LDFLYIVINIIFFIGFTRVNISYKSHATISYLLDSVWI